MSINLRLNIVLGREDDDSRCCYIRNMLAPATCLLPSGQSAQQCNQI